MSHFSPKGFARLSGALTLLAFVSCSGDSPGPSLSVTPPTNNGPRASLIAVVVDSTELRAGSVTQATATVFDQFGGLMAKQPAWSVEGAAGVATISEEGRITTIGAGNVRIVAKLDSARGEEVISVSPPPAAALVVVTLDSASLAVGQTTQARFVVLDSSGAEFPGRTAVWSIAGPATVATISSSGVVSALAPGAVRVVATVDGVKGEAPFTVTGTVTAVASVSVALDASTVVVGRTTQARAIARDAAGNEVLGKTATWSAVGGATIGTIAATGVVTAVGAGTLSIVATIDGVQGSAPLTVSATPITNVSRVTVTFDSTSMATGSVTQARFAAVDSAGVPVAGKTAVWAISGSTTIASVSAAGVVTALQPGATRVAATVDGVRGEGTITIVRPGSNAVSRVTVTFDSSTIRIGQTTQARFTALNAAGGIVPGKTATWSLGGATVAATVSAAGVVTGVAAGTARVVAKVDNVSAFAIIGVIDTSASANQIRPAEYPRDTTGFDYPAARRTIPVNAGDNLQTALNQAQRGDELVLQAGATFTGNFTMPAKPGSSADGWIVIRSSQQSALPPMGTRVTPTHAALMPKVVTPNASAALQTAQGATGWWVSGVEVTISPAVTSNNFGLLLLGDGTSRQNSVASMASDLVVERSYVHSLPTVGTSRCIGLNSGKTVIRDSYLDDCHLKGFDSQAIAGWNGAGPYRIENNTLKGAGENVMFGGADPGIRDMMPSDILIRRNYIYTPPTWKTTWTKKNLFELKNAQRVAIEDNVLDGSWADGQVGYAFLLKSANQNGGCPWCATRDVTIRRNLIRNAGAGFNLLGREGGNPHKVGELLTRLIIEDNFVEEIQTGIFRGDGRLVQMLNNPSHIAIRDNTMYTPSADLNQFIVVGTPLPSATGVSFVRNIVSRGKYGMWSTANGEGERSLTLMGAPVEFKDNVVIGSSKSAYPPGTTFVATLQAAQAIPNVGANEARIRANAQNVIIP